MNIRWQLFFILIFTVLVQCANKKHENSSKSGVAPLVVGAEQYDKYKHLIDNKKVALVVNQTSMLKDLHLVDFLLAKQVDIKKVFAPEHGFRGDADAGANIKDALDHKTGLKIISLYGKNKKPQEHQLKDVDVLIFDIQDVGVRFYTYLSTLHYVLEACAKFDKKLIILDRPNPNGHYIDGPILQKELQSFVGLHPVPIVHGMTLGEFGLMIKGEKWIKNANDLDLIIVSCMHYDKSVPYNLPIRPSPNLPNRKSVLLYPSLCLFEGTSLSVGRGTNTQFQVIGHPELENMPFSFKPVSKTGATNPKFKNKSCNGVALWQISLDEIEAENHININYLLDFYKRLNDKNIPFFNDNNFFDKLAGTYELRNQLKAGKSAKEIRLSWKEGLENYELIRKKYLLY